MFDHDGPGKHQWTSDPLSNHSFKKDPYSFHADNVAADLSADGSSYAIKGHTSKACAVDVKFERTAPGFIAGKDGKTLYGTDHKNPWGSMYHAFWPRCKISGTFKTGKGEFNVAGTGTFIHALQGMKPHHAAARWNFACFHGPRTSAVMMEFTTPKSYGNTVVNVAGLVEDDKLVYAGTNNKATHVTSKQDQQVHWPEPGSVKFEWNNGASPTADLALELTRSDRVDVMAEVPGFVKQLVSSAAGTRPYIYQVSRPPPPVRCNCLTRNRKVHREAHVGHDAERRRDQGDRHHVHGGYFHLVDGRTSTLIGEITSTTTVGYCICHVMCNEQTDHATSSKHQLHLAIHRVHYSSSSAAAAAAKRAALPFFFTRTSDGSNPPLPQSAHSTVSAQ